MADQEIRIDGRWDVVSQTPMGQNTGVLTLVTDGDVLTGTMDGPGGILPLDNGKIHGNALTWTASSIVPMPITAEFSATISGDRLTGEGTLGPLGKMTIEATRKADA
jgi:hypothetical protein